MKTPKVGDRVIVKYDSNYQGYKGTIVGTRDIEGYSLVSIDGKCHLSFHESQLRRLKPPKQKTKPPEFVYVNYYTGPYVNGFGSIHLSKELAESAALSGDKSSILKYKLVDAIPVNDK